MTKVNPLFVLLLGGLLLPPLLNVAQEKKSQKTIPDYSMNDRKDVPTEYTWKIEDLFPSIEAWQGEKEAVVARIAQIDEKTKGWTASAQSMLALLDLIDEIDLRSSRLSSYASHQGDTDMGNNLFQRMEGEIRSILVQLNSKLAFLQPDVLALGVEKFSAYLKAEPKLAPYRFTIESILREKDHILPGDQQRIASLTGLFSGAPGRASGQLNDVELPPAEITLSDGQKATLNFPAYLRLRASKNAADRTTVMTAFWKNQKKFENTLAILQDGAIKQHWFSAQIHNYTNCLEARLFGENITSEVYQQLIRSVHEFLPALQRYLVLKQKMLGLPKFRYEDVYASAVQAVDKTYTFNEARKLISEALKPLGKDYAAQLKQAFDNRWMDLYPNKGKESGAYSGGVYGVHPFIKLNFNGDYDAVSTVAHELGHAMHSQFSNLTQPYATSNYTTFLAEIASTFNEHMLMHYLLKNEKDDLFKLYILDNYLDGFRATLYRQTLLAEFELVMHNRVEQGQTLTADWLDQKYLELTRQYYGHDKGVCQVDDYIAVEWNRIPHFYLNYYVFQYSTGLIASMALSDMVLHGGVPAQNRYLDLLKAGGSDYPLAILKKAGVDMTTAAPYAAALKRFDQLVGEMEAIVVRLKNQKKF
ncbi:MAG: oligoendopeptidase F [Candidatus Aminicenantes bacterium]|nr:oligoendopeptidase F [Candidatus Aminicenantes bacterium]